MDARFLNRRRSLNLFEVPRAGRCPARTGVHYTKIPGNSWAAEGGGPYKIIRKIIGNSWAAEGGGPYGDDG